MSDTVDLFQSQIDEEVEKQVQVIVKQRITEIVQNPEKLMELWAKDHKQLLVALNKEKDVADKYRDFLDAEGLIDAAEASAIIRIEYIKPDGNVTIMGRNYFLKVLLLDGVLIRAANGYRLSSRYEKNGLGLTRVVNRNDYVMAVSLFNAHGLDRLIEKYKKDTRIWRSTTDHNLYTE